MDVLSEILNFFIQLVLIEPFIALILLMMVFAIIIAVILSI